MYLKYLGWLVVLGIALAVLDRVLKAHHLAQQQRALVASISGLLALVMLRPRHHPQHLR